MSRDTEHGGTGWSFASCLWSPTHRSNGSDKKWSYWELMRDIQIDDTIIHLRGKGNQAEFVGFSVCSSTFHISRERPPIPGKWDYADSFYRVELEKFKVFDTPVKLNSIFAEQKLALKSYFTNNKLNTPRNLLFYTIQSNKLQCQNGAYLSVMDDHLFEIVFGTHLTSTINELSAPPLRIEVPTKEAIREIKARVGQSNFSGNIKQSYGFTCCFPNCTISGKDLLIGAHIARWADNHALRKWTLLLPKPRQSL